MKDYLKFTNLTNKDELRKKFILKYEIQSDGNDKKIVVYFANGNRHIVAYTSANEKQILHKMKQQIKEYAENIKEAPENIIELRKDAIKFSALSLIASILFFVIGQAPAGVYLVLFSVVSFLFSIPYIIYKKYYIKDFEKNAMFLQNEEFINKMINSKEREDIFYNVNINTLNACYQESGKKGISINSIDKLNLYELKHLLEVIKCEISLFDEEVNEDVKEKELIKK